MELQSIAAASLMVWILSMNFSAAMNVSYTFPQFRRRFQLLGSFGEGWSH